MTVYQQIEEMFDAGKLDTTYPPSVYEAYMKAKNLALIDLKQNPRKFADSMMDAYMGYFEDRQTFVDAALETLDVAIPAIVAIDYEATWERGLRHQYDFVQAEGVHEESGEGHYFTR